MKNTQSHWLNDTLEATFTLRYEEGITDNQWAYINSANEDYQLDDANKLPKTMPDVAPRQ